ncbi:QRFP-like peptide receptor [Ciona intestinalis]
MGLNYPQCDWIFTNAYLEAFAHTFNVSISEADEILNDALGPCAPLAFDNLPNSYVTILIVLYSIIMTVGILGNLCVIVVISSSRKLWKVVNFLLLSLACSDLLLALTLPWTIIHNTSYDYTMGSGLCKAIPPLQGTAVMSSINCLVAIALERHQAIVYPTRQNIFRSHLRLMIAVGLIWICSFCFQIPQIVVLDDVVWNQKTPVKPATVWYEVTVHTCQETWSPQQSQAYSIAIIVMVYAVPLALLVFLYGRIGYFVFSRRGIENSLSAEHSERSRSRRIRLNVMLVLLVTSFALLWGPYFVFQCLTVCLTSYCSPELVGYLQLVGHVNVAVDPLLYAALHERVREEFIFLVRRLFRCKLQPDRRGAFRPPSATSPAIRNLRTNDRQTVSTPRPVYTLSVTAHTESPDSSISLRPIDTNKDTNVTSHEEMKLPGAVNDPYTSS